MARGIFRTLAVAAAGILVSGGVSYLINHIFQEHYRKITIGRDTTVVSGPFLADGRIDFLSAVNGKLSEGVTPENNAAVPLFLAMDPKNFFTGWRLEVFRRAIGVKDAAKDGEAYVDFGSFMFEREVKAATRPQQVRNDEMELKEKWDGQAEDCRKMPWKREDHSDVFAWLERDKRALELIREAGRRERYFSPLIEQPELGTTMLASISSVGAVRSYVDLLAVDAMLAVGSGDFARWREDTLTQKRLGRHLMHSGSVMEFLAGMAITSKADDTITAGLKSVPAQEARAMLAGLRSLPGAVDINDCLDQYERLGTIGEICTMAYFGPSAADISRSGPPVPLPKPQSLGFQPPIHFDDLLREHNAWTDRRVAAGRMTPYSSRKAAFAVLEADCQATKAKATGTSTTAAIWQLIMVMVEHGDRVSVLQDRMVEQGRLAELGLQLAIYHGEHGSYPKTLAELGDVGEAGKDLFADDAPVHYVAETGMIYSVGPNQRDDKGVYDRPVDKRPLNVILSGAPAPVVDYPDDIAVKLP